MTILTAKKNKKKYIIALVILGLVSVFFAAPRIALANYRVT